MAEMSSSETLRRPALSSVPNADIWASWKQLWQRAGDVGASLGTSRDNGVAWQAGWQHLTEANMRLMQKLVAVSQHQASEIQRLVAEDYGELTRVRDGGATLPLPAQQIALAHKRFTRNVATMRSLADEMAECLFEAWETAASGWAREVATELPKDEPIHTPHPRAPAAKLAS